MLTIYTVKNKRLAITNILDFLKWADCEMAKNNDTVMPINWQTFEYYFSRNEYNAYLELLKNLEVMIVVPYKDGGFYKYNPKKKKKIVKPRNNLYRFYDSYVRSDTCIIICNNKVYGHIEIQGKHNKKMIDTIRNVSIDYKGAIQAEIAHYKKGNIDANKLRMRLNKLFSLNGKRTIHYGNKVNRVYTSLSNLSKISREYLHIYGTRFENLDIVNCQPLLLCYYLIKNDLLIDQEYIKDCEAGVLYENFYEKIGDNEIDKQKRDKAKEHLYKSIYFDFQPAYIVHKKFAELYPQTYCSLEKITAEFYLDTIKLAGILQNVEAEIFNDLVPANSKYYFTLFDAVYFTDITDISQLENDIYSKFAAFGIKPKIANSLMMK